MRATSKGENDASTISKADRTFDLKDRFCQPRATPISSIARFRSIWSSSSLRSINTRTVGLSASAALNNRSAVLIIVKVLPLPCVCQTKPRRASFFGGAVRQPGPLLEAGRGRKSKTPGY
jgi:hypothetical protein